MVHVIATIEIEPGTRTEYLKVFNDNVPNVKAEDGCLAYGPTVDLKTDMSRQGPYRENVVTIVEQWESLDKLMAHSQAPHMTILRERVKDMVKGTTLQILEPAG